MHWHNARWRPISGAAFIALGYKEAIVPAMWLSASFERKAATPEILGQMWTFKDKGDRDCCLIPEVTALFQEMVQTKELRGEQKIFYVARCYRYERPQEGRYREFTQLGVEILNPKGGPEQASMEAMEVCKKALESIGVSESILEWDGLAKRGLGYYLGGSGFEASCPLLGAQRQLAGGGAYAEGAGFAIGMERALLAQVRSRGAA